MSCKKILVTKPKVEFLNHSSIICCELLYSISCLNSKIIHAILQHDTLLISSLNGAISLIQNLFLYADTNTYDLIKKKNILSIGKKTYDFLKKHSFQNLLHPFDTLQSAITNIELKDILYLSGYHSTFKNYKKYGVKRLIVYKAIEKKLNSHIKDMILNQKVSHITLYSKRSAEIFFNNVPKDYDFSDITFICISKNVASFLKNYNTIFPNTPTEKSMNDLIQNTLYSLKESH